jgi:E3 ubiquitin-protein ligase TRIP12
VIPGTNCELKPKGKDTQVTEDNLYEYIQLLLESMLSKSIEEQVKAFKKGFNRILKIDYLKMFKAYEIELIICGNNDDEKEWSLQNLKDNVIPAHGYHETSNTYLNLLTYMTNLTPEKRRIFLTFVTGSPRLPLGGKFINH